MPGVLLSVAQAQQLPSYGATVLAPTVVTQGEVLSSVDASGPELPPAARDEDAGRRSGQEGELDRVVCADSKIEPTE